MEEKAHAGTLSEKDRLEVINVFTRLKKVIDKIIWKDITS